MSNLSLSESIIVFIQCHHWPRTQATSCDGICQVSEPRFRKSSCSLCLFGFWILHCPSNSVVFSPGALKRTYVFSLLIRGRFLQKNILDFCSVLVHLIPLLGATVPTRVCASLTYCTCFPCLWFQFLPTMGWMSTFMGATILSPGHSPALFFSI